MCGCKKHWQADASCTCNCPEHDTGYYGSLDEYNEDVEKARAAYRADQAVADGLCAVCKSRPLYRNDLRRCRKCNDSQRAETHQDFHLWVPHQLMDELRAEAEEQGLPLAEVFRKALGLYLRWNRVSDQP
jgi:hypothetical protein